MAGGEQRLFECKTCFRRFATFQALGGHRTAHARRRCGEAAPRQMLSLQRRLEPSRAHACPVCGLTFPMGQALGGHMRRHKTPTAAAEAASTSKPGAAIAAGAVIMAAGKQLQWLDLNLPPLESELQLQFAISEDEGSSNAINLVPNCSSYSA